MRIVVLAAATLLALPAAAAAAKPHVLLLAPTHAPKADAPWPYAVVVTDASGRFVRARLHMQITLGSLPVGQVGRHTVDGLWAETLTWPHDAIGQTLTFEVDATVGGRRQTIRYQVATRTTAPPRPSASSSAPGARAAVRNVHAPRALSLDARGGETRWVVTCNVPGGSRTVSTFGKQGGALALPKPASGDCAVGVAVTGREVSFAIRSR